MMPAPLCPLSVTCPTPGSECPPGARVGTGESRPGADPGQAGGAVSPGGFPTPPRTGASVMFTPVRSHYPLNRLGIHMYTAACIPRGRVRELILSAADLEKIKDSP